MSSRDLPVIQEDQVRAFSKAREEPDWLLERRLAALGLYAKHERPVWKRTDSRKVDFDALVNGASKGGVDVERSTEAADGVIVMPLEDAVREHEEIVKPFLLTTAVRPEEGAVEALAAALWNSGTFMYVPRGVEVDAPLVADARVRAGGGLTHTLIVAEATSKASVVERLRSSDDAAATVSNVVEVIARDGAKVSYASVQDLNLASTQLSRKRAVCARDSTVDWMDAQFGTALTHAVTESILGGPGSGTTNRGAFFASGTQRFDITSSALHRARATSSDLNTKGAVADKAYAAYYGLVNIGHEAPDSSGHQKENTLLLSDSAHADAIPKLDVENNQVRASHAATVGQVDREQLFYIKSRGLKERQAVRVLVEGFFEPLVMEIPLEPVRDDVRALIEKRLE